MKISLDTTLQNYLLSSCKNVSLFLQYHERNTVNNKLQHCLCQNHRNVFWYNTTKLPALYQLQKCIPNSATLVARHCRWQNATLAVLELQKCVLIKHFKITWTILATKMHLCKIWVARHCQWQIATLAVLQSPNNLINSRGNLFCEGSESSGVVVFPS